MRSSAASTLTCQNALSGVGRQLDQSGGKAGGFAVAERRKGAPDVEVERGAYRSFDALSTAPARTERLRENGAHLLEISAGPFSTIGRSAATISASRRTFAVIGSVSRYQA